MNSVSHCSRAAIVIRGNIMAVYCCLPKSYFVNIFYLFFYRSMNLYISESYFVCVVSLTHSLRLFKPHLAWKIHYQSPFTLNAFKNRIILTWNDMYTRDCDIYCDCVCGCDVSACAAGKNWIGSESVRRETDRPVTDLCRSCHKSADSDHWPVNRCIYTFFSFVLMQVQVQIHGHIW